VELVGSPNHFPGNGSFISHPQIGGSWYYTGDDITLGDGFQTAP